MAQTALNVVPAPFYADAIAVAPYGRLWLV